MDLSRCSQKGFCDLGTSVIALDVPADWGGRNSKIILKATQDYLKNNKRKRSSDGRKKGKIVAKFDVGQYVLLQYLSIKYRL